MPHVSTQGTVLEDDMSDPFSHPFKPALSPAVTTLDEIAMAINERGFRRGIGEAVENFCDVAATADAQEGLRAFVEKRPPNW